VARALTEGKRDTYESHLDHLEEMLKEPGQLRALGPLASELERSWQEEATRMRQKQEAWRTSEILRSTFPAMVWGAIMGFGVGAVATLFGMPVGMVLLAMATGAAVMGGLEYISHSLDVRWSYGDWTPQRTRPARRLPLAAVEADALLEERQAQRPPRSDVSDGCLDAPGTQGLPGFDCLNQARP
jgi:hypothetical protein